MQNENLKAQKPLMLLTARQMRALEQAEMESGRQTGLALMERAGAGVVSAILMRWPELATARHRALILSGPGNNGGDGFVIARRLIDLGWHVEVYHYGAPDALPPDARANFDRLSVAQTINSWDIAAITSPGPCDLIVDAVFGIGLTRNLPDAVMRGLAGAAGDDQSAQPARRVAVDCPSGLDLDTGHALFFPEAVDQRPPFDALCADLTVTFHCPKPGHYLSDGPAVCGSVAVVDIGLKDAETDQRALVSPQVGPVLLLGPNTTSDAPWPLSAIHKSRANGHKYNHGHALIFSGEHSKGGAARLAARAALRSGAGLVTVISPPDALAEHAAALDAVMVQTLPHDAALDTVADQRATAFCLGPGMGVTAVTRHRVLEVLQWRGAAPSDLPGVVLDADALTVFEDNPDQLFQAVHHRTVLTPHEGEFARLFPDLALAAVPRMSKIERVRTAAARAGCTILLKGPDTVIATPKGRTALNAACYERATPWLATAGAGDVLAGLISGLAASDRMGEINAMAEAAAWLHVECALQFGPGLIAEDLPEQLPRVFRKLLDQTEGATF